MNIKRTFEEFINEKREDVGKYNTVKKVIAKLGRRASEQELASFINNNYYDVTEVERGDDDPAANDKIADLVAFYKFDIDDWEIAWADAQNESLVIESKEEEEARAILSDLMDEFDPWELSDMLPQDAKDTVASYGHKGAKAKKIADYLLSMAQNGEFESKVNEARKGEVVKDMGVWKVKTTKEDYKRTGRMFWQTMDNRNEYIDKTFKSKKEAEKWLSESVVNESKDMTFTDYLEVLDVKFKDAMAAVKGENGSDAAIEPTRGDILQNFTLFRNYVSSLTKKYKGDKTKLRFLTERVDVYNGFINELAVNEAKSINRDAMIEWLQETMKFVSTTEEFDGSPGGIWVSGEDGETLKGKRIYDYYNEGSTYEFGVLKIWEKELNKRGWYSEWYDAGTVMIWQD